MHALRSENKRVKATNQFPCFFHFWAWDLIVCTRSQQQRIEPRKSNIQSQAIQFIPVRDIQNLQRQSSATFTPFSLLRKSRRSFVFAKVHVLILQPLHSCMASQLLRSCRHRRRICVSLTAQGFSWSIRSRRSPTNCQGIHSVMHLGTGYLWPKYHPGRLLITQMLEKMEHRWAQETLPPWCIHVDRLSDFAFETARATESVLDCNSENI